MNGYETLYALPLYERLENEILTRIPDVKVKVTKTQIAFANKRGFAFALRGGFRNSCGRSGRWTRHVMAGRFLRPGSQSARPFPELSISCEVTR
ncbi:MAG: DUF5655 domain-containing protein [Faecousia sp.]